MTSGARKRVAEHAAPYLIPALVLYGIFALWPLAEIGWLSLQHWNGYGAQRWIGAGNFVTLLSDSTFRATLVHSAYWELTGSILPTMLSLGLALVVRRSRAQFTSTAMLFLPLLLPATVVAALWAMVYSPDTGPLNAALTGVGLGSWAADWLGDPHLAPFALFVAWVWSVMGAGTFLFLHGLRAIDPEYYLLARVEGAGTWWCFVHVTLPGLRRTAGIVSLVNAALAAQVFDLVFVTTGGGPGNATMLLPIDAYSRAFGGSTGQGAAVACIQVGIGLALAVVALLLLRDPITLGAGNQGQRTPDRQLRSFAGLSIAFVVLLPLGWLALAAVSPGRSFVLLGSWHPWDVQDWTGTNIAAAWNAGMAGALVTSMLLACAVVTATVILAIPAAFALVHIVRQSVWRGAAIGALTVGLFQPLPVLIIPLFEILRYLGLFNTVWGIVLPEIAAALPFSILLLFAAFRSQPREIAQAARVDGASPWQHLVRVALPLALPAAYAVAVWAFITSWNQYLLPTVVSQDGSLQTVPTALASSLGRYNTAYGPLAAGTLLALLPAGIAVAVHIGVASLRRHDMRPSE